MATALGGWPVGAAAAGVTTAAGTLATAGDDRWAPRVASISKLLFAWAALVAVEEGTIALDDAAGPPGATMRHLLSHAAGYGFNGPDVLAEPGARRIYSNTGIDTAAAHLEARSGLTIEEYLRAAVFEPLAMTDSSLVGSVAFGVHTSVRDLLLFAREVLSPTLIAPQTADLTRTVQFPTVSGVVPGVGSFDPNPWAIGFEVRGAKTPHWMGESNGPATIGHFGGSGTFLWVDHERGFAACALTDTEFGPWSLEAWPAFSNQVVSALTR